MTKHQDAIDIAGTTVEAGQRATINLPVADLYTTASLTMPVQVIRGRKPGPSLFVSAAIHGDELNGVEIIRRLLALKSIRSIRGTLFAVPIVNVHGFLDQSRYLPDRRDLNRSFPGSPKGSIAARLAHLFITEIVERADYGIDLHTGAIHRSNLPQIRANLDDPDTLALARAFGAPVIVNSVVRDGSLREFTADRGKPVLVYESGEALRFDETGIRTGLRGILDVMRHIGMLSSGNRPKASPVVAHSTRWVRASASGIVVGKAKLGDSVAKGQRIAQISDPLGDEQVEIIAPCDGIVIGRSNLPLAHEGDALFNLGTFEDIPAATDVIDKLHPQEQQV